MSENEGMRRDSSADSQLGVLRARVADALARIEAGERDALDGLQGAVCAFVGALRGRGATAEQVAAEVRVIVEAPAAPQAGPGLTPTVRSALVELAEEWCTAEYARGAAGARSGDLP